MSYINAINKLDKTKKYDYCFIGYTNNNLGRKELLKKFQNHQNHITFSDYGRNPLTKFILKPDYYQYFCHSKFGLCPIHQGAWYRHDYAWSYRFIETVFCKSIPIVFKETPMGKHFVKNIFYLWDDQRHDIDNYHDVVDQNYQLALNQWTLQPDEIDLIKSLPNVQKQPN